MRVKDVSPGGVQPQPPTGVVEQYKPSGRRGHHEGGRAPSYEEGRNKYCQLRSLWVCGLQDMLITIREDHSSDQDKFCSQLLSFASTEVLGCPNAGAVGPKRTNLALILISPDATYFNRGYVVYMRVDYFLLHTVKFPEKYTVKPYLEKLKGTG